MSNVKDPGYLVHPPKVTEKPPECCETCQRPLLTTKTSVHRPLCVWCIYANLRYKQFQKLATRPT